MKYTLDEENIDFKIFSLYHLGRQVSPGNIIYLVLIKCVFKLIAFIIFHVNCSVLNKFLQLACHSKVYVYYVKFTLLRSNLYFMCYFKSIYIQTKYKKYYHGISFAKRGYTTTTASQSIILHVIVITRYDNLS